MSMRPLEKPWQQLMRSPGAPLGERDMFPETRKDLPDGEDVPDALNFITINYVMDGGGATLTVGKKKYLRVDFACIIREWAIFTDVVGSIQIDINRSTYADFPTTTSITAAAIPSVTAARKNRSTALTGWTPVIYPGDVLEFEVDSVTTVTGCTIALKARRL